MFLKIKFVFGILFWGKRLFAGTVPANKNLFAGTCSGKLFAGTSQLDSLFTLTPEMDSLAKKNDRSED